MSGNCPFDDSVDAAGNRCGGRSAESRGKTTGYDPPRRGGGGGGGGGVDSLLYTKRDFTFALGDSPARRLGEMLIEGEIDKDAHDLMLKQWAATNQKLGTLYQLRPVELEILYDNGLITLTQFEKALTRKELGGPPIARGLGVLSYGFQRNPIGVRDLVKDPKGTIRGLIENPFGRRGAATGGGSGGGEKFAPVGYEPPPFDPEKHQKGGGIDPLSKENKVLAREAARATGSALLKTALGASLDVAELVKIDINSGKGPLSAGRELSSKIVNVGSRGKDRLSVHDRRTITPLQSALGLRGKVDPKSKPGKLATFLGG